MKQAYVDAKRFRFESEALIKTINGIIEEYQQGGFRLTIRQLYYQLVSRLYIPNKMTAYKNLVRLATDARMAGLMDWDAIEDRTRELQSRPSWSSAGSILDSAASSFHMDMWKTQDTRVWVVVEKEALAGVLWQACYKWDVPLLAARGYPSATTLREFAEGQMLPAKHQRLVVLHLGDHDPSGIDMSRDLVERLELFTGNRLNTEYLRIALNREQIDNMQLPENPAKATDARWASYVKEHGSASWELDALPPNVLVGLIDHNVEKLVDPVLWATQRQEIEDIRERIKKVADDWEN